MPFCAYCGTPVDAVSYAPCPSCGNPRNGAPRPVAKGGGSAPAIIAVVVIGAFVVVAIVGILAAIAIPNLLTAMQRSKQRRTMADMQTLATAAEAYAVDNHRFPAEYEIDKLQPTYVKVLPKLDGWGHPFKYACWSTEGKTDCDTYAIASAGKDGQFEQSDVRQYLEGGGGATTNFNSDIVYSNGKFIQYPQGLGGR